MFLKNNSKNSWLQYDCGICKIDILPESVFEVSDEVGEIILKRLGSPNWVIRTEKPQEEVKEKAKDNVIKKRLYRK